jgi:hypothetical protein
LGKTLQEVKMINWEHLSNAVNWERLGNAVNTVSTVVMAGAAVWALLYAIKQIESAKQQAESARADAREQTAKQIWTDYHIKGLEYPEFSNPQELLGFQTLKPNQRKYLEYTWFVSFLLLVCDEILRLQGGANWKQIVKDNLGWHHEYLKSRKFKESGEYEVQSEDLKKEIRAIQRKKFKGPSSRTKVRDAVRKRTGTSARGKMKRLDRRTVRGRAA